ncbi:hypothetical protein [Trabulsiella odontotermitis]|nr:hypothetical protein [Trabulsiella odontotermitis]
MFLGHMRWCMLEMLARRDGVVQPPTLENRFLTRWLAIEQK